MKYENCAFCKKPVFPLYLHPSPIPELCEGKVCGECEFSMNLYLVRRTKRISHSELESPTFSKDNM